MDNSFDDFESSDELSNIKFIIMNRREFYKSSSLLGLGLIAGTKLIALTQTETVGTDFNKV